MHFHHGFRIFPIYGRSWRQRLPAGRQRRAARQRAAGAWRDSPDTLNIAMENGNL